MAATAKRKTKRSKPLSSRDKVRTYRARKRAQGLRLVQIWVPNTRSAKFRAEARRQSRLLAESPNAEDDQAFVDAIQEFTTE
jgi:hypothetical protein